MSEVVVDETYLGRQCEPTVGHGGTLLMPLMSSSWYPRDSGCAGNDSSSAQAFHVLCSSISNLAEDLPSVQKS